MKKKNHPQNNKEYMLEVNKDPYEHHKQVYDIVDQAVQINNEMKRLSKIIDEYNNIPNSLQAMLGMIYRYEGTTQSQLAEIYEVDPKNTIKYVSQLVKRGYIEKKLDGNKKRLYLTTEGQAVNGYFMKTRGQLIDHLLNNVDPTALAITRNTLFHMSGLMKNYITNLEER